MTLLEQLLTDKETGPKLVALAEKFEALMAARLANKNTINESIEAAPDKDSTEG